MKSRLLTILLALLPLVAWGQGTTTGDESVAAPTFRFDGDYLVIETATEDASIFYQMADLPDMSDETIEKVSSSLTVTPDISQSMYYEQPILLQKPVVLKAIAAGATESEVSILVYDYDSWQKLQQAMNHGIEILTLAANNTNVSADLIEQLSWAIDESKHFYNERATMDSYEAQHLTNIIYELCAQIEQQMSGSTNPEPYAVLSDNNTVLTFYYDDQKAARNGMSVGQPFDYWNIPWDNNIITSVIFDDSFANCTSLTSTANWFYECTNLVSIIHLNNLKTDNVTDMAGMFYQCLSLTSLDLSGFNTANVTDMAGMFYRCSSLTSLDLSGFNTANVTNMVLLFSGCFGLTSLDLSGFNTANVTNMESMFSGCFGLTSLDLSGFNTSSVKNMNFMFNGCSGLTSLDLSGFNTGNVTDMHIMFFGCSGLTSLDLSGFNTGNVTDMQSLFEGCFGLTSLDLSGFNTANVTDMRRMFYGCSGLTSLDLSNFNTGNVTNMELMFNGCSGLTSLDLSSFNTANVTDISGMFIDCSSLTSLNVSSFKNDNVTNMRCLFYGCSSLTSLDLSSFNTANVTDMYSMFFGCTGLASLDLSGFNTANVADMSFMFLNCSGLTGLDLSFFNTANVTNMRKMFDGCSSLTSLDLSGFNTANVTDMFSMFYGCSGLTSLDLSGFNTANVTWMASMFCSCSGLTSLNLSGFKTDHVSNMSYMFAGCSSLTSLDLSSFKTDNMVCMSLMFSDCSSLKKIFVDTAWSTKSVEGEDGYGVFANCTSLVGGKGTVYDSNYTGYTYAHIDGGPSNPGYLTDKNAPEIVAAPTFRFDGDYLVIETATEDASIFYQMADLPDMSDETIEKVSSSITVTANIDQSNYYEQPIELKKSVVLKAIAAGATESEVSVLVYDYDSWHKLQEAIEYGEKIQSLAQDNANVDEDLKEQLKWILYESMHFYEERAMMPYQEAQHFTNHIFEICAQIEQQMGGQTTAEPYAVLSENNTVLTFYYDDQKANRPMYMLLVDNGASVTWENYKETITSVVFDPSFANYNSLVSTADWFSMCKNLSSITGLNYLNTANVTSMGSMFSGCSNLTSLNLTGFNTENVTYMAELFRGCKSLTSIDVSGFNTGNVTHMQSMFDGCAGLNSIDISGFNTEKVINMNSMFSGCSNLTELNLSNFNTSKVSVGMNSMFAECLNLKSVDLSSFNTANVSNMGYMFRSCVSLTSLDLSNFNTGKVTNMSNMFYTCKELSTVYVGADWNTSAVKNGVDVFTNCTSLVGGKGTAYDANHTDYTYAHIDGGPSNPGYFTDKNAPIEPEAYAVLSDNGSTVTFYYDNQKIQRNGMEMGACDEQGVKLYASATKAVFDPSFANDTTLTTTSAWFYGCEQLKEISGLQYVNTSKVTNMASMFQRCSSLQAVDVSKFDTRNVENMDNLFDYCSSLTSLDLSNFNTAKVTTMGYMFVNCHNLTSLNLSSFDTRNVKSMRGMFSVCSSLKSLDLSNFNTESLEITNEMFYSCSSLESLDLSSFNTKNVNDMFIMFFGCSSLNTIYVSDRWSTASVTEGSSMFNYCSSLVGGAGTVYDENHTGYTYAHIDGGPSNPGYFTSKDAPVIDATFDSNGVLTVGSGTTMADALEYVGGRAEVAKTITAIVWDNEAALTNDDLQGLDNPNMLIYVKNEALAPANINNVVIGDFSKNIVLTDVSEGNGNFYCPMEFKAESITYSHYYGQTTEIGVARGWESIALPFNVQTIMHETKGLIAPFGNDASNKHFWMRQLTENGLARATVIEPNTAYLISMPNNDAYYADFNLNGLVTFSSVDVWVPKTQVHAIDYHTEDGTMIVLLPNFQSRASDYMTYSLNVGEQRGNYPEGSVFEREYRDVRPFEAYTIHHGNGPAPQFISVSDLNGGDLTGIESITTASSPKGEGSDYYMLDGRKLQGKTVTKGVYIRNGKKVIVK